MDSLAYVYYTFFYFSILEANNNQPPLTYRRFQSILSGLLPPPVPLETVTATMLKHTHTPVADDHDDKYGVPSLEELGKTCYYLFL